MTAPILFVCISIGCAALACVTRGEDRWAAGVSAAAWAAIAVLASRLE